MIERLIKISRNDLMKEKLTIILKQLSLNSVYNEESKFNDLSFIRSFSDPKFQIEATETVACVLWAFLRWY